MIAVAEIKFSPPDISELEINNVIEVLKSGWITTGPKTKLFEKKIAEFCGTDRAVCLNSATACLELILRVLGIKEGDEVITSAYTYTASASPVIHVGAKLILVDTAPGSYEMDYEQVEKVITKRTKAIIPVDLGGVLCDYKRLYEIVDNKKTIFEPSSEIQERIGRIAIVADSAHAFGASQGEKRSGSLADFTSFSFHAVKNLTTGEGGALTWKKELGLDNEELYKRLMLLSLHGQSKDALEKTQMGSWEYDIVSPAYKCNMTDIMAAIGLGELERYPELLKKRKKIIDKYDLTFKALGAETLEHYTNRSVSSGHLYLMRLLGQHEISRNRVIVRLAEKGIPTNVHYKPLPMMTAYQELGFRIRNYPNSYSQYENEITLPLHTKLNEDDVEQICRVVSDVIKEG